MRFLIRALLAGLAVWLFLFTVSLFLILGSNRRRQLLLALTLVTLLACSVLRQLRDQWFVMFSRTRMKSDDINDRERREKVRATTLWCSQRASEI
jgi:O-antigen ligase